MALLRIAEVFGHDIDDHTAQAKKDRANKRCPFKQAACTKDGATDPLAVCSMTDGESLATLCPYRFQEGGRIFTDVGELAFGKRVRVAAVPEVHILRVKSSAAGANESSHRVGKVDFLVARLDADGRPEDFVALEVQAVYFSGKSIRPGFHSFMRHEKLPKGYERRPDWRSSAQKRLMPQISLKVPVFRRWGRKFFIAVDSCFFEAMPSMNQAQDYESSEIVWLVYDFSRSRSGFRMGEPKIVYTTLDEVQAALREGVPPTIGEILAEVSRKMDEKKLRIYIT